MDGSDILDIQPRELNFLFELKKQSSCSVRLRNNLNDYVAFKVKTTSPKKYCVRPNVGIIQPGSFYEFTVTMQAPKIAPPDMICKDKFLVQSIVVPAGTSDDDITSSMFSKDDGRYVQEVKLRVLLLSSPNSPILSPINATLRHDPLPNDSKRKDHVLHKLRYVAQNTLASDEAPETKLNNSETAKTVKDLNFKPKRKVEDGHPEYGSAKELEDHLTKYVVYNNVKKCSEDPKTLDHLSDKEDSMGNEDIKTLNHVKDADYSKMSEDSRILDLTDDLEEDAIGNGDIKTLDHVNDEYYSNMNDDSKTLDVTDDLEYEALNTVKHLKQSFKDRNKVMDEVMEFRKDSEYPTMDDMEVKLQEHHNRKKDIEGSNLVTNVDEMMLKSTLMKNTIESKLVKEVEEMKSKINMLEMTLKAAKVTISELTEEKRGTGQEKECLRQELASLRSKRGDKRVQVGFPFLFVCMVALVSIVLGYTLRC